MQVFICHVYQMVYLFVIFVNYTTSFHQKLEREFKVVDVITELVSLS